MDGVDFVTRWRHAQRSWPDRPAVVASDRSVTVAELAAAATQVSAMLVARGVGRGSRVAICLEHRVGLLATLIGVMEAGAAFVPIDARYPAARVAAVITAADVALVVTDRVIPGVAVPHLAPEDLRGGGRSPISPPPPTDTAYVMFTSGSTGAPKGVMVSHRALGRYLDWAVERYLRFGLGGAPLFTSIGFDLTLTSALAPLVVGRPVTLVSGADGVFGVADLLASGASFDFVKLTPSHLRLLLADGAEHGFHRVAALVLGGEALTADLVQACHDVAPTTVVINEYGPTEATVGCCAAEMPPARRGPAEIGIGTAIPSVSLHVWDEACTPVPGGAPGELYIGGGTLADGYLGLPRLTAERFVADPATNGGRLYRSGDVVRRRGDDDLIYLGRSDDQLKIRGHRVEPGELAAVLRENAEVTDCAVGAWHRMADDVRLVAYVVTTPNTSAGLAERLRAYAAERLPEYLVPQHIVQLAALPQTINGKLDRTRLPEPHGQLS